MWKITQWRANEREKLIIITFAQRILIQYINKYEENVKYSHKMLKFSLVNNDILI